MRTPRPTLRADAGTLPCARAGANRPARANAKRDCERSVHDVLQSNHPILRIWPRRNRLLIESQWGSVDRLEEQATTALDPDLGARPRDTSVCGTSVGDHDVLQRRRRDPLHRLAAEHRVASARADAGGPAVGRSRARVGQSARGVDDVRSTIHRLLTRTSPTCS